MRALALLHRRQAEPVGMVVEDGADRYLYRHIDDTGWHRATDAPGGFDLVILDWLERQGVDQIHVEADGARAGLYTASIAQLREDGLSAAWEGRLRVYLAAACWERLPGRWYALGEPDGEPLVLNPPPPKKLPAPRCLDCALELSILNATGLCGPCHAARLGIAAALSHA